MRISPHPPNQSTALAIFARLPIPGRTKTRLIPLLGPEGAAEFHAALLKDTARKVAAIASRSRGVVPYLFLPPPSKWFDPIPPRCTILPQRGRDLGARLDDAFRTVLGLHSSALVMGTDSPLVAPRTLRLALDELRACDAVLGPCPDGGYYLVGLRASSARAVAALGPRGIFEGVRWGTASAFHDTLHNLLARGRTHDLACSILDPVRDVDRPRDFHRLASQLARDPSARRLAPATWRFIRAMKRRLRAAEWFRW